MARPWFRMYREMLGSPKIQKLKPEHFKAWVNILCCTEDDGAIPNTEDLAFMLRATEAKVNEYLSALKAVNLLDEQDGVFHAHDWDEHQYASDVSTGRVKRFRERSTKRFSNGDGNAPDTEQIQNRAEAEQTRDVSRSRPPDKKKSKLDRMLDELKAEELANGKH